MQACRDQKPAKRLVTHAIATASLVREWGI
jgi:hypothetical protein